jgi:hypothetical protein
LGAAIARARFWKPDPRSGDRGCNSSVLFGAPLAAALLLSWFAHPIFGADPAPAALAAEPVAPVAETAVSVPKPTAPVAEKVSPSQAGSGGSITNRLDAVAPPGPSKNVIVNLINRLIKRGVLSKEDSEDLIQQAEEDANRARAVEEAAKRTPKPAPSKDSPEAEDDLDAASGGAVSVTYVPECVKEQMREEIKQDVLKQAREENWAAPRSVPDWVKRWRLLGDLRARYEGDYFPAGNNNTGNWQFVDFNKINAGSPLDVGAGPRVGGSTGYQSTAPFINTDMERQRARLRARGGAEVDLGDSFIAALRAGAGESNSPVSGNQSLGLANQGQGGDFSKYQIWLDRAFIKYELGGQPSKNLAVSVGRFDNPFMGTTLMWANDLGFDGIAASGKYEVLEGVKPFLTTGFFPVFNNDLNFGTYQTSKFKSRDKWLAAIQLGNDWKVSKDWNFKAAGGFFDFQNIEGKVSNPYFPQGPWDQSSADNSRPSFAQKGNTYSTIRNIIPSNAATAPPAGNSGGTVNQWQYFGLATPFREVEFVMRLDYSGFDPFHVWVVGDYVRNIAWNWNGIMSSGAPVPNGAPNAGPYNNINPVSGVYEGGKNGWLVSLNMGKPALQKFGDWSLNAGYRYVESDCVVDGFCDSDFGGGGTNIKGYTVGGSLALGSRVWFTVSWMSANAIAGPTFKEDVLQLDLNAKF